MNRLLSLFMLGATFCAPIEAETLTLEQCRVLALDNNKELKIATAEQQAAHWTRKSAFTNYLPKISASGGYLFTSEEISLLSDEQKQALPHMGDVAAQTAAAMQLPIGAMLQQPLNAAGQSLVDALDTDTRNAAAIAVMLKQPIYMGGKIRAYNKIAREAEEAAGHKISIAQQELLVKVDETFWQIVALESKRELAEAYRNLVGDLEHNVDAMITEGVATKADGLSVKVKLNQANTTLIQVENGVALLKMLLCQLCGLDVNSSIELDTAAITEPELPTSAVVERPELMALENKVNISRQQINLARAETLPTVALTGGYLWTNPSLTNGFERRFNGLWNVGVMVNIPIITWGDRIYKVRAARAKSDAARLQLEETREKIDLQVAQSRQKVEETRRRLAAAEANVASADENLRYATLGLSEGVIPVINVNEAQTAWLGARSELIAAQIDHRLAIIHLRKSLGQI